MLCRYGGGGGWLRQCVLECSGLQWRIKTSLCFRLDGTHAEHMCSSKGDGENGNDEEHQYMGLAVHSHYGTNDFSI